MKKSINNSMSIKSKGFTLIEILIVMFIVVVVSGVVFKLFNNTVISNRVEQDSLNMRQNLRAALHLTAEDIRMAGYPGATPTPRDVGITAGNQTSLTYTLYNDFGNVDIDGDGIFDGVGANTGFISTVTYSLMDSDGDSEARELCRVVDTDVQEIASHIELVEFFYTYIDDGDAMTDDSPNSAPTPAQCIGNLIESIEVTIVARGTIVDNRLRSQEIQYGTTPGGTLLTYNDNRHRQVATVRVFCRNIN